MYPAAPVSLICSFSFMSFFPPSFITYSQEKRRAGVWKKKILQHSLGGRVRREWLNRGVSARNLSSRAAQTARDLTQAHTRASAIHLTDRVFGVGGRKLIRIAVARSLAV
jgi:hypothetical protein